MLFNIIFTFCADILAVLTGILKSVSFIVPTQIASSVAYFFSYLGIFNGILPMSDILQAFMTVLVFWGLVYSIKVLFMIMNSMPFIRTMLHLPNMKSPTGENIDYGDNSWIETRQQIKTDHGIMTRVHRIRQKK